MNKRPIFWLAIFILTLLIVTGVLTAVAAANNVAISRAEDVNAGSRNANLLKPPQCTMNLTNIVVCPATGTCTGTANNDLILGSSGGQTIRGGAGDDCIVGGGGNDKINGQGGTDVCIGGPGTDTFSNCETQIQ
jgi:Ca2+-binding RTX toxin-like protein